MRLRTTLLTIALAASAAVGCSSSNETAAASTQEQPREAPLVVEPGKAAPLVALAQGRLAHCRKSERLRPICPRLVPRVGATYLSHLSESDDNYALFDLERGVPDGAPPVGAHVTIAAGDTGRVAPFERPGSGQDVEGLDDPTILGRERSEAVSFGRVSWGGREGLLFLAPPLLRGGQIGDHLIFEWGGGSDRTLYSLHAWQPLTDTAATLREMVQSISTKSLERRRFTERGVSLQLPDDWSVSGFSETVFPRRLVAASYPLSRDDVEGDCGGFAAVERLPRDGAYLVLIDYGGNFDPDLKRRSDFKQRLPLKLEDGQLAEFECFGRSYAFRFIVGGRGLQAHIGIGLDADPKTRMGALAVLNSVLVRRAP